MDEQPPLPVRRYLVAGLIAAAAISGLLLLVRPILFSFAPPLDDSNYNVAAAAEAAKGPLLIEIVLNESHAIPGEVHRDQRVGLTVVVAPVVVAPGAADAFTAVDAWSPTHDCPVTLGADRLVDCAGDTWTYGGVPIKNAQDPWLISFPASVSNGAVLVDFTHRIAAGS